MNFKAQWPQRQKMGAKDDPLKKAIGYKKDRPLKVLDLTGGLFRDAYHMARMGCEVTALEELKDLASAFQDLLKSNPIENLQILNVSAEEYLAQIENHSFDVAYYDPMFPEKKKSALPGKEAQYLQSVALAKTGEEEKALLAICRKKFDRVVVKRPLRAEAILPPSHEIKGKSIRFDVYRY